MSPDSSSPPQGRNDPEAILVEALRRPPHLRAAFVQSVCEGSPHLAKELLDLLSHADQAHVFFGWLEEHVSGLRERAETSWAEGREGSPSDVGHDLASGEWVGTYRILGLIGAGGMGTVYRAYDERLQRVVALKFLPPRLAAERQAAERFLVEARAAAALDHPHICTIHEVGETEDGRPFLAMPLYEGETLRERLGRGPLEIEEALAVAVALCRALAAAHGLGIVHRDVKPGNVMLTDHGEVKLLDFGLAQLDGGTLARPEPTAGTVAYMAPEQVRGESVDARTDLWSLGVVLYEMLAGQRPFQGGGDRALIQAILHESPRPLRDLRRGAPEEVSRIVGRLLRKAAADRYRNAEEVLGELTELPSRRRAPKKRLSIAALAAASVAAIVALAVWGGNAAVDRELDGRLIAVLPFRVAGAEPSLGYLREGMLDLLAARLTDQPELRAVDPRTLTSAWRRAGGEETDLTGEEAADLARGLGAGRLVLGDVSSLAGRVVLTASLRSTESSTTIPSIRVEGPEDSLAWLVDRLAAGLLAAEAGEGKRIASLTTSSLPALRAYLQGQRAYRRGRPEEAVAGFSRAVRLDTTFAVAALMMHLAATWVPAPPPFPALETAWRHRARLGARDRVLLTAEIGPDHPARSSGAAMLAARSALAREQPDNPEAWFRLGDFLVHFGAYQDIPDSSAVRRATESFLRALELDADFLPALKHLFDVALLQGDTVGIRRYGSRYLRKEPTGLFAEEIRSVLSLQSRGSAALPEVLARADSAGGALLTLSLANLQMAPHHSALADTLAGLLSRRLEDPEIVRRVGWTLYGVARERGRPREASRYLDAVARVDRPHPLERLVLDVRDGLHYDGDSAAAARAADDLAAQLARPPASVPPRRRAEALCVLGQWRLAAGDAAAVTPILRQLRALGSDRDAFEEVDAFVCAELLAIWRADLNVEPDVTFRLVRLDSLLASGYPGPGRFKHEANLVLARLLERNGELEGALRVLRRYPLYVTVRPYRTTFLRERGRVAVLVGDTAAAIHAYRRYLSLRSDPEPPLAAEAERVRQELARLRSTSH